MPQLNPAPWFMTFLLSWMILTMFTTPKLLNTMPQKEPHTLLPGNSKPWIWPWS